MGTLTQERLKERLSYDPATGVFTRLVPSGFRWRAGDVAGSVEEHGYVVIGIDGTSYKAHRLAWLYMTGVWPAVLIDHEDTNRSNNVWTNLREATNKENSRNSVTYSSNTSGIKGVSWYRPGRKWVATIRVDGVLKHLGYFSDKEAASVARQEAANKFFGVFANHGSTVK